MQKYREDKQTLKWLYNRSKGQRIRILLLMIGNGLFAASSIWFALVCKALIDAAVDHRSSELFVQVIFLIMILILQVALRIGCNSMLEYVRCKIDISMKQSILEQLLKKEYQGVAHFHSGELLNRLFSDVQVITEGITGILPSLVNMVTRLVMAVAVMIAMDPSFTLLFLAAGVLVFAISRAFRSKIKRLHKQVQDQQGIVRSYLQEILESLLIVKVFGIEKKMQDETQKRQDDYFAIQMKRRTFAITANTGLQFVFQLGYIYAMGWGAVGLYHQTLTYGSLTAVLQMVGQIQTPFSNLSGLMPKFYNMLASAERLIELENLKDEEQIRPVDCNRLYRDLQEITFSRISFSYGRTPVLKNSTFRVEKGDFVAITGLSGGGKSTMFLLMLGAYHPNTGEIAFCVQNRGEVSHYQPGVELRRLFAYVPQGNHLFSGSIRENVTMLNPEAEEQAIWQSLQIACADEFVRDLPDGLETFVGEHGSGFSEGQVQRIAIARALLGGAPILLLDEATSALDEDTEAQLLENIAGLKEKTCFIVTHRRAALAICNRKLTITDGTIYEGN